MKVSLNTIKQFTPVDVPINELVSKINQQLGSVEQVTDLAARYDGAVIVKVESCEKHQNADKLNICQVDDGTGELTQVVCGAPNVHAGMFAVWLKPGSTVPSTADDAEPFVLGARELRGVMSNGMLASPNELGIGDSHDGILEILENDLQDGSQLAAGAKFAETFGLNDTTIDIENKMFTHRPDLFGQLGVAREIAGIFHNEFISPEWYTQPEALDGSGGDIETFNEAGEKVPRIMFMTMKNIVVKPSPLWLQCALVTLGGKPINNVVDATNYIMLITAQPTHAYDYDKLRGGKIGARMANSDERISLLNGKTYELVESDIVIADGEGPIGLGGIMGGSESEVSSTTTNIVIEVATFDMYAARKSSMRHGIFTDALTRFNKGQSQRQNAVVLSRLVKIIQDVSGGQVAGAVNDMYFEKPDQSNAFITPDFINRRLGLSLDTGEIAALLRNVEFEICESCADDRHDHGAVHYEVPFWRTDIEMPEDIVEEIGRLYGFDKLPRVLPSRTITPAPKSSMQNATLAARSALVRAGANEVLTYSFVHEKLFERAGQDKLHAFKLSNALSPDLQYYRLGLTPSLLDKVTMNLKAGYEKFGLFEVGKVHFKGESDESEPTVPNEDTHIGFVVAYGDKSAPSGAPYYHARRYLSEVIALTDHEIVPMKDFDMNQDEWGRQLTSAYEPSRSALIVKDGQTWGVFGELREEVRKAFKLSAFVASFEIHTRLLAPKAMSYRPLSKYPSVSRDVSLKIASDTQHSVLIQAVHAVIDKLDENYDASIVTTMIYQPEDKQSKTVTLRLTLSHHHKTLTDGDVRSVIESIVKHTAETCHAVMV